MITACTYPVINPLASSARPTLCGAKGHLIITDVPYDENRTGLGAERIIYKAQMLCLKHSVEIAAFKFTQEMPRRPFTGGELEFLMKQGFELVDLIDFDDERSPHFVAPAAIDAEDLHDHAINEQITQH